MDVPLESGKVFEAKFVSPNPYDQTHFDPATDNLSDNDKLKVLEGKCFYYLFEGELSEQEPLTNKYGQPDMFNLTTKTWSVNIDRTKVLHSRNSAAEFNEDMSKTSIAEDFGRLTTKAHFLRFLTSTAEEYGEAIDPSWDPTNANMFFD